MPLAQLSTASTALKQWAVYPQLSGRTRLSSPQTFRLLIETTAGHLLVASTVLREPPDFEFVSALAMLVDDHRFADQPILRIQGEFEARHGHTIELLDVDLDRDDPVSSTGIVARSLVVQINQRGSAATGIPAISAKREEIESRCRNEWADLRIQFIERLDAEGVRQARLSGGLTPSAFTYVITVGAEQRRNRAQALHVFPLLRPYLMTPPYQVVREAIDKGQPLIAVLASHWQAPRAMIKAMRGIEGKDLGLMAGRLPMLLRLLNDIPADWWPRDATAWRLFVKAIQAIQKVSKRPITSAANQLWLRDCARRKYEIDEHAPEEYVRMGEEIEDFMDMLGQALEHVQAEALRRQPLDTRAAHLHLITSMRASMGLEKLARTARRFGDNYRRAIEEFAREAELWNGVRWPVIGSPDPRPYSGVIVHPLQTPEDLRYEGQRMRNCVASYVEDCLRGRSQIWSLRLADGSPLSTLETRTRSNRSGQHFIEVVQHKGHANELPPAAAKRALQDFMMELHGNKTELAEFQAWRQKVLR